ncbi:MAG: TolC family protein [Alphaproteobacteria bacterium]|nr:TolC family protein [Alphaproteobacteria bacterium]
MRGIYMLILTSFVLVGLFCAPAFAQQNQAQQTNKRPESLADISKKDETRRDKYISNTQNIDDAFLTQTQPAENILPQPTKPVEREALLSLMSAQIIEKLTGHPKLVQARAAVCTASFAIALGRSAYFPKVNVSLSGGDKLINRTTRADEFGGTDSPEYDGRGLNATVSVRQQLYDWGNTSDTINIARVRRNLALLERDLLLNEQTGLILRIAIEYVSQDTLLTYLESKKRTIEKIVESVEERFRAGAGRLAEIREAQIIRLEQQAEIDITKRRRDQAEKTLRAQFDITPALAVDMVNQFIETRPDLPAVIVPTETISGRIIDLEMRAANYEYDRLQSARLPKIDGVLVGRAWDIEKGNECGDEISFTHPDWSEGRAISGRTGRFAPRYRYSNCHTYELVGNVEFTMPLYDGGANKAQRGEVQSRLQELAAGRRAHIRDHQAESNFIRSQLLDFKQQIEERKAQIEELNGQLESLLALQGKTQSDPLSVMRLQMRVAQTSGSLILLQFQAETVRLDTLLRADALARTLDINLGDTGC